MLNKRTLEIQRFVSGGEITHWSASTNLGEFATAPTFLEVWDLAYQLVTGDFGDGIHDNWADLPESEV